MLGNVNDVQVYRSLIRQGVSDYLVPPVDPKQVLESIAGICAEPGEMPPGRVIAFIGAKGGTGSSTVAHNTAWSLAKLFSEDVSVLDLDLAFGTVGLAFNLEAQQGIEDALAHPERLDEVLLERFTAKHDDHLYLLTARGSLESDAEIDPEAFDVLLNLVRRTVSFVVLDLPHQWSSWTRHVLMSADEIVLTATPDLACLRDSKTLIEALTPHRVNDEPIRLVLNNFGAYRKTQLSVKDFENAIEREPTLVVPYDAALFGTAANNGQMIGDVNKRSKIAEGFRTLARTISGRETPEHKKGKKKPFSFLGKKGGKKGSK